MNWSRVGWTLLSPLSETWLIRYTGAFWLGIPLRLVGRLLAIEWLEITGIVLCAPFVLWIAVFFLILFPIWLVDDALLRRRRE